MPESVMYLEYYMKSCGRTHTLKGYSMNTDDLLKNKLHVIKELLDEVEYCYEDRLEVHTYLCENWSRMLNTAWRNEYPGILEQDKNKEEMEDLITIITNIQEPTDNEDNEEELIDEISFIAPNDDIFEWIDYEMNNEISMISSPIVEDEVLETMEPMTPLSTTITEDLVTVPEPPRIMRTITIDPEMSLTPLRLNFDIDTNDQIITNDQIMTFNIYDENIEETSIMNNDIDITMDYSEYYQYNRQC